jgi:hypothetical protein
MDEGLAWGRSAYLIALETGMDECRELEEELSTLPPGILRVLSPQLAKEFGTLICSYNTSARDLYHILWDFSLCSTVFRSLLKSFIRKFDTHITSEEFWQLIIVQKLDRVPELLEFSASPLIVLDQLALLASMIHHVTNLQIFKYPHRCITAAAALPHLTEVDFFYSALSSIQEIKSFKFVRKTNWRWALWVGTLRIAEYCKHHVLAKLRWHFPSYYQGKFRFDNASGALFQDIDI